MLGIISAIVVVVVGVVVVGWGFFLVDDGVVGVFVCVQLLLI